MRELIWTHGDKPERSFKKAKNNNIDSEIIKNDKQRIIENNEHAQGAILTALGLDAGEYKISSKREEVNTKLGMRELVGNKAYNPFLSKDTYVNDLGVEDTHLRPRNSNT